MIFNFSKENPASGNGISISGQLGKSFQRANVNNKKELSKSV
jgi:hypothetical protein